MAQASRLNDFAKLARTAVSNWRFIRVQFDYCIVNSITGKRSENVFDRVNFYISFSERGGTIRFTDVFHSRFDFRLAVKVNATKTAPPLLAGAGKIVMFTRLPLCRPMPEKLAERLRVC